MENSKNGGSAMQKFKLLPITVAVAASLCFTLLLLQRPDLAALEQRIQELGSRLEHRSTADDQQQAGLL